MFGFGNNYGKSFWPFKKPDETDLLMIEYTVKEIKKREIRKLIYMVVLIAFLIIIDLLMLSNMPFASRTFPIYICILAVLCAAFFLFRLYYFRGDPEEYAVINDCTVMDDHVRFVYAGRNRPRAREFVDVLCPEGQMCYEIEVLTARTEFTSFSNYVQKFYPGNKVKVVRINANVVYAIR